MTAKLLIRDETESDIPVIGSVTAAAFTPVEISNQTEPYIIEALRSAGALTLSLVAEVGGEIVGHIAFSPVRLSDGAPGWFGLGPVSVLPTHQRKGVGGALIREGLSRIRERGARGCCLVGHPQYYRRFGFENATGLGIPGVPDEVFFVLPFDGHVPRGVVAFHEAFGATAPESG